jgi:hypothetical protein
MSGLLSLSNMLQCLVWMPVNFFAMQLVLPPYLALMLSGIMALLAFIFSVFCRHGIKAYVYKLVAAAVSVLMAVSFAGLGIGTVIIILLCMIVFMRVWSTMKSGKDLAIQAALLSLFLNVLFAFLNVAAIMHDAVQYGNAAIFVSTVSSVVVLIIKQMDESRSFGKNSMDISKTQRRNNQIFGGVFIIVLLLLGSVGHVSNVYKLVLGLLGKTISLIMGLFTSSGEIQTAPPQTDKVLDRGVVGGNTSLFEKITQVLIYTIAAVAILAFIALVMYTVVKCLIKLIDIIKKWLGNREEISAIYRENGHIDEKQSLYGKNLKNMADRLRNAAKGFFDQEIPYNKLPDQKAKVRRLLKYFSESVKQKGVAVKISSTADEICREASNVSPGETEFNSLLSKCYNSVRYGDMSPLPHELQRLEEKILKRNR